MKLIRLYIENFGCLSGFQLDFEQGITTINRPNGFGKTTLAEFIRAMFYGFPRKTKTLEKSKRQKYTPWNGGAFGGNLIFEYEGQCYRLERTFGATPKGDTFTLIDLATNRKSNRFSAEIGAELFGLDADSFERSIYLPQMQEEDTGATASIQAKLSDLVEDSGDVGNFDKAISSLRTRRSALIPYRGSGGSVAETAAKITQLQMQLDEARALEEKLKQQSAAAAQAQSELDALQQRHAEILEMLDAATGREKDCLLQQQYAQLQNRHRRTSEQLSVLRKAYRNGLPKEDALHRAEIACGHLAENRNYPTAEQLAHHRSLLGKYAQLQAEIRALQLRMEQLPQVQTAKTQRSVPLAAWIFGIAGMAGGGALLYLQQVEFAALSFCITLLALLLGAICGIRRKKSASRFQRTQGEAERAQLQQQMQLHQRAAEQCGAELAAFFDAFAPQAKTRDYEMALLQLEQQIQVQNAAIGELKEFFRELGLTNVQNFRKTMEQLRADLRTQQNANLLLRELEAQLADMERTYGEVLLADFSDMADAAQLREQALHLRNAITATTSQLLQAQQNVHLLRRQTEGIPALWEELEFQRRKLAEEREKVQILDETIGFLQQAKENLATAYLGTIRAHFGRYLNQLEATIGTNCLIDTDLQVQLECMGQVRELAYFSAGQADLVMLCMRLALVDALFKDQNMFVILDDPFVNLDDVHTAQALKLLRRLARDRQILYLTCHSSRSVEM